MPLALCFSGIFDFTRFGGDEEAPHDWPAWRAQLAKHLPRFV